MTRSRIRERIESELDDLIERVPNSFRFERTDRKRTVDWHLAWDLQYAARTIHRGRYLGGTPEEKRVLAALDAVHAALRELSDALRKNFWRRIQIWEEKHGPRR
jgi:hypothetical protein